MKEHVLDLVDVYMDGETDGPQSAQIEAHLAECGECRAHFSRRSRLSSLLRAEPGMKSRVPDRRFAAAVLEKIETRPGSAGQQNNRPADLGWIWIPILLVVGLVFIQTVWLESNLVQFVPGVDEILQPGQLFLPFSFALPTSLAEIVKFLSGMNLLSWNWSSTVLLSLALSFLYVSWLAGWWVRDQKLTELIHSEMES